MLNWLWPPLVSCRRRRQPSGNTELEPLSPVVAEEESPSAPAVGPSTGTEVLEDPGGDPRAELVYFADQVVYYGLVGLTPKEVNWESDPDLRWYCVWLIPGQPQLVVAGIRWGVGLRAYTGIRGLIGGAFLDSSGIDITASRRRRLHLWQRPGSSACRPTTASA